MHYKNLVTLVLILHGRHDNLDRQLLYYKNKGVNILIADSSNEEHNFSYFENIWTYKFFNGLNYTQKIEAVLQLVKTPYIALCADDDFIIPNALFNCVEYLERNLSYSIAQGNCICYAKESVETKNIVFKPLYPPLNNDFNESDPFKRLESFLSNYRSVLYAVHRTEVLKEAFLDAGKKISNLFLNEYLTIFIPLMQGKCKELPILYQIREYALDSDDKTSDNLGTILTNKSYKTEKESFIEFIVSKISLATDCNAEHIEKFVQDLITKFSQSKFVINNPENINFKKKVGKLIKYFPLIGNKIIIRNREKELEKRLSKVVNTSEDLKHLAEINEVLRACSKTKNI